ncbi:MAG: M50 family metallopeptidase [Oscillospiraceae bacterium]|nr:M50 family metallopeptidase [Oscillospiraceae bacterium]
MKIGKFNVSAGFVCLIAALYYFDRQQILIWFLLACMVHEAGHWSAIRFSGGQVDSMRLTAAGAEMIFENHIILPYYAELLTVLAGPTANLLLAVAAGKAARLSGADPLYTLAGISTALALFNLLPAFPLDGGQAVFLLISWMGFPICAGRVLNVLSLLTAAAVTAAGGFLFYFCGNFTLLLVGAWLLSRTLGLLGKNSCQHSRLGIE